VYYDIEIDDYKKVGTKMEATHGWSNLNPDKFSTELS